MDPLDPTAAFAKLPDLTSWLIWAVAGAVLLVIAAQGYFCWKLSSFLKAIPPKYRKQPPNSVWLIVIPVAGDFISFSVYSGIARSYRAFFESMGVTEFGDCGEMLGRAVGFASVCCLIPMLDTFAIPAVLVLTYAFVRRISALRAELPVEARAVTAG